MQDIWSDPRYVGRAFYDKAQELGFKTKDIEAFVEKQEGHQLTKDQRGTAYFPVWGHGPGSYQADLMFVKDKPILCVVNVNSRYAYAYALTNKGSKGVADALSVFVKEAEPRSPCEFLQTDNGSEFLNKDVAKVLERSGVTHTTVEAGDHRGQSYVERFNQTLRRLVQLWTDTTGVPWRPVLPQLVENYNNRYHRVIMMPPSQANDLTGMYLKQVQYEQARKQLTKLKVGDSVRKQIHKATFDKGRVRWSKAIHTIESAEGNRFVLSDGSTARHYELQKVPTDTVVSVHRDTDVERAQEKTSAKKERDFKRSGLDKKYETFDGQAYVGQNVRKKFEDGKYYAGAVVSYDAKARGDPSKGYGIAGSCGTRTATRRL